jgi:imidazolonepropionase-like amidohydrolase
MVRGSSSGGSRTANVRSVTLSLRIDASSAWLGPGRRLDAASIVIERGAVAYAGSAAGAPEGQERLAFGGFVMPAVADRHVHIRLSEPGAVLAGGVAAVRDLAWVPDDIFELASESELPTFAGPLIRAAGPMLTAPGGYPTRSGWAPAGAAVELEGPEHATRVVRELAARGAAAIKVSMNADAGPTPSDAELAAIVDAARAQDLPVTAHVQGRGQAERAVGASVDEFAHTPWTERLSDELLGFAARATRIVSTLDILSYGEITPELRTAADNLVRFRAAGGTVVYGTDLGNGPIPAGIDPREALLLHEAVRMTPEEVLAAMTATSLEPGAPADLIGLARDPLDAVDALGDLRLVVRAGRIVVRP